MDDKIAREAIELVRKRLEERNIEVPKIMVIGYGGIGGLPGFTDLERMERESQASFLELESYAREMEHEHPIGNNFMPRSSRQEVTHGKTNSWPTPKRRGRK